MQLPQRHKKRRRLYHHDASIIRLRPRHANHVWSIDFVHDKLSNGRPYKMLTVLDEYTREALCVKVATSMGSSDVLEALYPLLLQRGTPAYIRSAPLSPSRRTLPSRGNFPMCYGTEFQAKFHWHVEDQGIRHAYIKRGTPQLNGKVERSHRSDQQEFYQLLSYKDDVDLEAKLAECENF